MFTHKDARSFACDQCEKSFNRRSHLKSHDRTHTRLKSFSCNQCSMAFLYGTQLKSHKKQIHTKYYSNPEESSIETKVSDLSEKTLFLVCDKVKDLKGQNLDKTMESIFLCPFCKETFAKRSNFEEHHENHLTYNDLINKVILA